MEGAEQAASFLRSRGHAVAAYSSKTEDVERRAAEDDLVSNRVKALVATSALGMGFDKPDIGFIVHLGAPPSPIAYYQQIGRAGRKIDAATVVLLPSSQDIRIWQYFALLSFPPEDQVRVVIAALDAANRALSTQALETRVDLGRSRLEHMLKVLDVDGAVKKVEGGWVSTGKVWHHDAARYERVSAARILEQDAMLKYIATTDCRLEFLGHSLDDSTATPCGRCDNCAGSFLSSGVSTEAMNALSVFVDRAGVEIKPRSLWPSGLSTIGIALSGRIPSGEVALTGRAIARLKDIGWGDEIRTLLDEAQPDSIVPDRFLNRVLKVLAEWADIENQGRLGVVFIESRTRPGLVRHLAESIAVKRHVPLLGSLRGAGLKSAGAANSARRVAALHEAFAAMPELTAACRELQGAVLLVDDFVDSGWTMTLAARVLRRAGAASVLPFALGIVGRGD